MSLFLAGCDSNKQPTTGVPFLGGEHGVKISLRENSPPLEVFDSGEMTFDIDVILKNEGEYTIPSGEAMLTVNGIEASAFSKSPNDFKVVLNKDLPGKEKSVQGKIIDSPAVDVEIKSLNYKDTLSGDFNFPFQVNLCYLYETVANVGVCFKENLLSSDAGVCNVDETKTVYNSGAPVQVETFTEYPRGKDKVGFSFDIIHKGNGKVSRNTIKDCSQASPMQKGEVYVEVISDVKGLQCRPLRDGTSTAGYVRLNDVGKATIDCEQTATVSGNYVKPITINLKYRYSDDISGDLTVKHVPQN